jgi:UDP-N-acetylbacillosamine N-acetyltransferase
VTRELVLYGVGSFAALLTHHLEATGRRVAAYAVDREHLGAAPAPRPVVLFDELTRRHPPDRCDLLVAVGYRRMRARRAMFERARALGYRLASFVSPTAVVAAGVTLGENVVLLDQVVVEPFASIGDHVVLGAGALVSHESRVGAHVFASARVLLAGRTTVGEGSFLAIAAATINDVTLAPETHLLPGTFAFQDTEPMTRYQGNPARAIGRHVERGIEIERG